MKIISFRCIYLQFGGVLRLTVSNVQLLAVIFLTFACGLSGSLSSCFKPLVETLKLQLFSFILNALGHEVCLKSTLYEDYLVDPASSHMLVSKTKPCMC